MKTGVDFKSIGCCQIFLIILLSANTIAVANDTKPETTTTVHIGAGPYIQSQPYAGAGPRLTPTPVVFFDNRLFYVRWVRMGMYVYGGKNWGLSLTAQPRPFGYQTADSDVLTGMADRHTSWEAGFALGGKNRYGFAEFTYFHDILNKSNGSLGRLEMGKMFTSGRWLAIPSLFIIYYSRAFNDYYYGVSQQEATVLRAPYTASGGINVAGQSYLMYDITQNWHIAGNLRGDYLNSSITNSPIVGKRWMVSAMLSLLYSFSY